MKKTTKRILKVITLTGILAILISILFNKSEIIYKLDEVGYEHIPNISASGDIPDDPVKTDEPGAGSTGGASSTGAAVNENTGEGEEEKEEGKEEEGKIEILIDAGHGGDDPGCNYDGIFESGINLNIALSVKDRLEALGYTVLMTREEDMMLGRTERSDLIKSLSPDLFVSIHVNSLENDAVTNGIETLYHNEINPECETFAQYIQDAVISRTQARDRGIKLRTNLYVLKSITCPGCIVETGFLSSTEERKKLMTEEYQEELAESIVQGIKDYAEEYFKPAA